MGAKLAAVTWLLVAIGPTPDLEDKVQTLAEPLVQSGEAASLALGLVEDGQAHTYRLPASNPPDHPDDRYFEIGSITKTFTGLLLADMVVRGEVKLDDPVRLYLPDSVKVPAFKGREITLVDLATHTSGLPRLPTNFRPKDVANPYADYSVENLHEFLGSHELTRRPGSKMAYSNLGMGLLGHVLGRRGGKTYEALLKERILEPLDMNDTVFSLDAGRLKRLAPGHDPDGQEVPLWDFSDSTAAAGALKSTMSDMLKYLRANMNPESTPLARAITLAHQPAGDPEGTGGKVGLAWQINPQSGGLWHNGGTGGFRSFLGFIPEKKVGAVVLCNTALMREPYIDRLGDSLLLLALGKEPKPLDLRMVKTVDPEQLKRCEGRYRLGPLAVMTITREGDRLYAQLTLQSRFRIYPTSDTEFFYRVVDAQISFEPGDDGRMAKLILHQNGRNMPAPRIEPRPGDDAPDAPR